MFTKSFRKINSIAVVLIFSVSVGIWLCPDQLIPVANGATSLDTISGFFKKAFNYTATRFGFSKIQNGVAVGSLKANFTVTPTGQAHYSIPIDVPPGTNNMEPVLAITYDSTSSNTHNGLLGMGFSLEGISSIARCPSDKSRNGEIHGVDFTDRDRFCLSGQQLVAIKGTYGQDGTEYRTYEDTQSRIISHGRQGNGPAYFTVETKGGQVAIYGNTTDSQNKAQGTNTVAVWGLNRIKDSVGNFLDVHYFKDESIGSFYPIEVDYSGNEKTGMVPYNSVKMVYEDRPDARTTYQAGSKVTLNKFLKKIRVYQADKLVYDYSLEYETSSNTFRSRITSIQKCDGSGNCLPATKFGWQVNEEGWEKNTEYFLPQEKSEGDSVITDDPGRDKGVRFVDLNGDGLPDFIHSGLWDGGNTRLHLVYLNTGFKWEKNNSYLLPHERSDGDGVITDDPGRDKGVRFVDLSGDGLPDFIQSSFWDGGNTRLHLVYLNFRSEWGKNNNYILPQEKSEGDSVITDDPGRDKGVRFVDLNGDGLPDFIHSGLWDGGNTRLHLVYLNTGFKWEKNNSYLLPHERSDGDGVITDDPGRDKGVRFVDLNGDGLPDFIQSGLWDGGNTRIHLAYLNTGSKWEKKDSYLLPHEKSDGDGVITDDPGCDKGVRFVDLNGDGLPDFIQSSFWDGGRTKLHLAYLNTGSKWEKNNSYLLPHERSDGDGVITDDPGRDKGVRFVDLNGDGLPDFIQSGLWDGGNTRIHLAYLNTGSKWEKKDSYLLPHEKSDGDGVITDDPGRDKGVRFVDLNGDGLPDFIQSSFWDGGRTRLHLVYLNRAKKLPDYLISITDGLGTQTKIDYEPLSGKKVDVYTKEHSAQYPNMDWQGPMYVVYQTTSSANISDPKAISRVLANANAKGISPEDALNHITTYHYTGAKFNQLGFGFLGFHQVTTKDETTGITKITTYAQDPTEHNIGKELFTETHAKDGTLIHSTSNEWQLKTLGGGSVGNSYYLSVVKTAIEKGYNLADGRLLTTKTVSMTFDDYANPTLIVNTISDTSGASTFTTQTTNTYRNIIDDSHWIPGQLMRSSVTANAPNVPSETHTSSFIYDDKTGLLMRETTEPDDSKLTIIKGYERDDFGNITAAAIANVDASIARVTRSEYDPQGRFVVKFTDAIGQVTLQDVDPAFGKPLSKTDINKLVTTYTYDGFGRIKSQTNPGLDKEKNTIKIEYYWVTNPNKEAKDAVYAERIQSPGRPDVYQYYDALNRLVAKCTQGFDGRNVWQVTQYDELDRITVSSLPYFEGEQQYFTTNQYDDLGRVKQTTRPDGSVVKLIYDGLTTKTINPLNQTTAKTTDVRGNIVVSTDAAGHSVYFKYDAFGRLVTLTDSKNNVTSMTYNKFGHKLTQNDPDKGNWTYDYDVLGEMLKQTDAEGNVTTFKYDNLGRVFARTDGKSTSTWEYGTDPKQHNVGLLVKEEGVASIEKDKNGAVKVVPVDIMRIMEAGRNGIQSYQKTIEYDEYARPKTTTVIVDTPDTPYITKIEYDDYGRVWKTTYPNGVGIENFYNSFGYLSDIKDIADSRITYWQLNKMDAAGRATSETHSNGFETSRVYDPKTGFLKEIHTNIENNAALYRTLQLQIFAKFGITLPTTQQENIKSKGKKKPVASGSTKDTNNIANIQSLSYDYDVLGNVKSRNDKVNNIIETFDYKDELNRLTGWSATGSITRNKTYKYDEIGNMKYQTDVGTYVYGMTAGPHAVTKIFNDQGKVVGQFKYDRNGNQRYSLLGDKQKPRDITYTSYEKPLVISGDNGQIEFYYNASREQFKRVDRIGNTITTLLSLGNYEVETDNNGKVREKVYVGPYTEIVTERGSATRRVFELLKDNLGSLTEVLDEFGQILKRYHYEPFGKQELLGGIDQNAQITHQGFTGHQEVEAFSLIHMSGRIYDPVIARFLSADPYIQDPTNTQSLNRYSYCLNNPLAFTDPTGYNWFNDLIDGVGKLIHEAGKALESIIENRYVQIAVGIGLQFVPGMQGWTLVFFEGAYSAFNTAMMGGNFGDVLKAGLMSAASAEFGNLTEGLDKAAFGTSKWAEDTALHGLEGGGMSVIEGGSFTNGFLSGAVMQAVQAPIASINMSDTRILSQLTRATADGIVGGSVAAVTGGNFSDTAKTSAFSYLCSENFALTRTKGHGTMTLEEAHKLYPDRAFEVVRPLDFGPLKCIPFIYPFVHSAMYYSGQAMGLAPGKGGIPNFSGPATVVNDLKAHPELKLKDYVVLNVPGFSHGFDARHMQAIVQQQATTWRGSSAQSYNLPLHNCHDYNYDSVRRYINDYGYI